MNCALGKMGWRVATVWECSLRSESSRSATMEILEGWLVGNSRLLEIGEAEVG